MDDVKKPLPVKIVEAIAWTYVALSLVGVLGAIVAECCGNGGAATALRDSLLAGSFPLALFFGMVLSLRRGSRAWFVVPNTIVTLLCLFGSAVALFLGLVALLLFVVPLVLLYMPTSTRWFKAKAENGLQTRWAVWACSSWQCCSLAGVAYFCQSYAYVTPELEGVTFNRK